MAKVSHILSEGALKVKYEDLSERNIKITKDKLLDNIGNIAGGIGTYGIKETLRALKTYGDSEEAPVFLLGESLSLGDAALINGMAARSMDYEPMHINIDGVHMPSKESATLINATLTAAAAYGFSGKDYITHELVGEDLSARIIGAGGRWNFSYGWGSDSTMPLYGTCAIFGRIRGLDALQLRDSWGIAMNMAAGTLSTLFEYTTSSKLNAGQGIKVADFATRLARENIPSLDNIFEGKRNIYAMYRGQEEAINKELLTKDYGKKFYMEESIKLFPVGTPATIVAFAGSEVYGKVKPEEIVKIKLDFSRDYRTMYYWPAYEVGRDPCIHAQFSFQYAFCAPILFGPFKVTHYAESCLRSPDLLKLTGMTEMTYDDTLPEEPECMRYTIYLKDGTKIEKIVSKADFDVYSHYPTREELLAKYWEQVDSCPIFSKAKAEKCIELVDRLEDLTDMRELTELLS